MEWQENKSIGNSQSTPKKNKHFLSLIFGWMILAVGLAIGLFFVFRQSSSVFAQTSASITGTPSVGEVITGTYTHTPDGTTEGNSTYKWYRDGVEITGATTTTYTPTTEDIGKTITFEVTYVPTVWVPEEPAKSIPIVGAIDCNNVIDIDPEECTTLVNFFNTTNGANWGNKNNWLQDETVCDNRYGVSCEWWPHVKTIIIWENNISWSLPSLSGLPYLYKIDLSYNNLNEIKSNAFVGMNWLTNIILNENKINSIPVNTFNGLTNLQNLYLWGNQISSISTGTFSGLTNLINLALNNNQFNWNTFSTSTFSGLTNLISLNLWWNQISSIPTGIFSGLINLQNLYLNGNQINTIPNNTFNGLNNVKTIYLNDNQINSISNNIFSGLNSLLALYLSQNQISSIPDNTFNGLNNLTSLELSQNQISVISNNTFNGLTNLLDFGLSENQISFIPDNIIYDIPNIQTLWISKNNLTTLPETLTWLTNLWNIAIKNNKICTWSMSTNMITFINMKAGWTSRQDSQDTSSCQIFNYCSTITDVTQSECEALVSLYNATDGDHWTNTSGWIGSGDSTPTTVCDWYNISCSAWHVATISLEQNNLSWTIPNAISSLTHSLYYFNVSQNHISSLGTGIFTLTWLQYFYANHNQLTQLPTGIGNLTNLKQLDINVNDITEIPASIGNLTNLELLYATHNNFTSLPDEFSNLTHLGWVYLNNGELTTLPESMVGMNSIQQINIDTNKICTWSMSTNLISFLNTKVWSANWQYTQDTNACGHWAPAENIPPVATGATFTTNENTTLQVSAANGVLNSSHASDANGDTLSVTIHTIPIHWTLNINTSDWSFEYIPDQYFNGTDHFTYYLFDGTDTGNLVTWTIVVNPVTPTDTVDIPTNTTTTGNIINEFLVKGYLEWTGTVQITPTTLVGTKRINTEYSDGKILVPFVMKGSWTTPIELRWDQGLVVETAAGAWFDGILNAPIDKPAAIATQAGLANVLKVVEIGNNQGAALKFKDESWNAKNVRIMIPVTEPVGTMVRIYSSQDGYTWSGHENPLTTVINILGTHYVVIKTTHATMFAIGSSTWSFVINNDAASTTSENVTLNINAPWAQNMRFSNDNTTRSSWESYTTNKSWTLSAGYGTKTVRVQFDTDGNTAIVEASTSDSINYISWWSQYYGGATGNIRLEITKTSGTCVYGTSLYIGTHAAQFAAYDMTGSNFTSAFYCSDTEGVNSWAMTMQASSDLSNGSQTIPATNVSMIASNNYVNIGACTTGQNDTSWISIGTTPGTILNKQDVNGNICTIKSDTVNLAVHIPENQAIWLYTGTLTLNIPF